MVPLTFHHSWGRYDAQERLSVMREFAANGAEHLVLSDTLLKMMAGDHTLAAELKKQTREAGVDFVDAHAPFRDFGDLIIPEERGRRQMIARQKLNLLLVNEMGVKTCTFHVGGGNYTEYSIDEHRAALFRSLDELLPLAEELDIAIAIENGALPFNTADELISCVRKYDSPYLGVCLDVGHANYKERWPENREIPRIWECFGLPFHREERIAERLRPYIVSCHLHDNYGERDDHDLPGHGNVDWKRIVPLLSDAPRLRSIQSEVLTKRRNIPIRTAVESIRRLFGE